MCDEALKLIVGEASVLAGEDLDPADRSHFLPTGYLQDLAIAGGWGNEFLSLANRFDCARSGKAVHYCDCGEEAATLLCEGGEFIRSTFTGTLIQPETANVRAAMGDAKALHAIDFELAPFYCPQCERTYCLNHWTIRRTHGIRGFCPQHHDRLFEG